MNSKQVVDADEVKESAVSATKADASDASIDRDLDELRETVNSLMAEREELNQQILRAIADFQNYKRRTARDFESVREGATAATVEAFLPLLDNLDRSLNYAQAGSSLGAIIEGIEALSRQFRQSLDALGVARIETSGHPFDPQLHEAISTESTDEFEENTVITEVDPGYRIGERIIRPARVKVATRL